MYGIYFYFYIENIIKSGVDIFLSLKKRIKGGKFWWLLYYLNKF